ncbi:hypothetical protein NP493_393g01003 [Ridgeia piscesae]|uniref:Uncharacterized protein n=1 Tax=Ridgeia piscesae TaxID=27915 RepID=A0AAD9NVP3_RIDPI|nr:hypothetical protein NP493_393g01003 [Ridgeia piscesae]
MQGITANMLVGPKFQIIAEAKLRLSEVKDTVSTYDLTLKSADESDENTDSSSYTELPLFGHFCCRLAAQPQCLLSDLDIGYLQIKTTPGDKCQRLWCQLRPKELSCWLQQPMCSSTSPAVSIPLTKDTSVLSSDNDTSIVTQLNSMSPVTLTSCDGQDMGKLTKTLQQHIRDQVMWRQATDRLMTFPPSTPQAKRSSMSAHSTLDCDSPMTRILNRLNANDKVDTAGHPTC